jgi:hypothetical protein
VTDPERQILPVFYVVFRTAVSLVRKRQTNIVSIANFAKLIIVQYFVEGETEGEVARHADEVIELAFRTAVNNGGEMSLWVKSGHDGVKLRCPLLPRKRTCPRVYESTP